MTQHMLHIENKMRSESAVNETSSCFRDSLSIFFLMAPSTSLINSHNVLVMKQENFDCPIETMHA